MRLVSRPLAVLLSFLVLSASAFAQQPHIADRATIDKAFADRAKAREADRQEIQRVLQRDDVKQVAERYGLSISRAESALATLTDAELRELAAHARQVNESQAGGATTITITTTTIIIILLIVIIIILLAD